MSPGPANPPPVPPYSPPPTPPATPLIRALCGPLLLTTLGVLLTLDYMGRAGFGTTWPVLLIVFGLCKIAERMGPGVA